MICEYKIVDSHGARLQCTEKTNTSVKQSGGVVGGKQATYYRWWCVFHREFMTSKAKKEGPSFDYEHE